MRLERRGVRHVRVRLDCVEFDFEVADLVAARAASFDRKRHAGERTAVERIAYVSLQPARPRIPRGALREPYIGLGFLDRIEQDRGRHVARADGDVDAPVRDCFDAQAAAQGGSGVGAQVTVRDELRSVAVQRLHARLQWRAGQRIADGKFTRVHMQAGNEAQHSETPTLDRHCTPSLSWAH